MSDEVKKLNDAERTLLELAIRDLNEAKRIAELQERRAQDIARALAGGRAAHYQPGTGLLLIKEADDG